MSPTIVIVGIVIFAILLYVFYLWYDAPKVVDQNNDAEDIDIEAFRDTVLVTAPPPIPIIEPAPAPEEPPAPIVETMAQFQIAYDIVRKHEGGFQIMPEDSGNYNSRKQLVGTNWGINAQVYEQHIGRPPTERDMRDMPRYIALEIYKRIYWDRIDGDAIRDQQVANIYFDGHVNHGRWGIQMMQRAAGVSADGSPGPLTLAAINGANPFQLFNKYKAIRRAGYQDLVRRRPKDQRFLRGWLIRIDSFVYQGGGLMLPTSSPGQGSGQQPTTDGGSGGIIAAIVLAITAYVTLK